MAKTRRASDPDAATIVHKGQLKHAYALHFATEVPSREQVAERLAYDDAEAKARAAAKAAGLKPHQATVDVPKPLPVPCVIRRMTVTPSTDEPGPVAVDVMNRLATDYATQQPGWKPGDLVEDMGYSQDRPESHHLPLRRAGWELFFDLKRHDRRVTAELDGAVTFLGATFCTSVAASVALPVDTNGQPHLPRLPIGASKEARAARHALVAALEPFRTKSNGRPDADGFVRRGCPAVARFTSPACVGCDLRGNLHQVSAKVPQVFDPPAAEHRPKLCRQTWVTLGPTETGRDQLFLVDSEPWYDAFDRRRPRVEGSNGIVKNPALGHIEKCRFKVRGRAKVTIFTVLLVAMSNLRQWKVWRAKCAKVAAANAELAAAPRRRARRRTGTYDQVITTPAAAATATDPPPDDDVGADPPF